MKLNKELIKKDFIRFNKEYFANLYHQQSYQQQFQPTAFQQLQDTTAAYFATHENVVD